MTELTLTIGNKNYSSWSLRPWLFLSHHGIPFREHPVSLLPENMAREMQSYFSDGKVPVLREGEIEVWDSLAILEYLAERFPEKGGWPAGTGARATARAVSAEMHSSFPDLRNEMPMNCRRRFPGYRLSDGARRDLKRLFELWSFCRGRFGARGPWLFGEFTVADCMYAPVVLRLIGYEVELDPVARAYCDTVYASPAIRAWVEAGKAEKEVIPEDEVDWPGEPL
ncbi:MAG TPA: glutathione S-transferase family protein [Sedimenticola sp.]|nr:glutathione S-transferase family protein [Sedimenticola sp.]